MLLTLGLAGIILYSCTKEFDWAGDQAGNGAFTVSEAKAFFEGQERELEIPPLTTGIRTRGGEVPVITPQWTKGREFRDHKDAYVEVPFGLPTQKIFRVAKGESSVSDQQKYPNTDVRLLAQRTAEGDYHYFVVHITGSFDYIVKNHKKIMRLHLDDLRQFSGEIRYFDLSGKLQRGIIMKNGRQIGTIRSVDGPEVRSATRGGSYEIECEMHLIEYEYCWHYGYLDAENEFVENGCDCSYTYCLEEVCYYKWVEDGDEDVCPDCGEVGCSGGCKDDNEGANDSKTPADAKDKLMNILSNSKIKNRISTLQIPFTKNNTVPQLKIGISRMTIGGVVYTSIVSLEYNSNYFETLSEAGKQLTVFHEYAHATLALQGTNYDHRTMINDPDYINGLKEIYPGESADFYEKMKYAGCADILKEMVDSGEMTTDEKLEITEFIYKELRR